MESSQNLNSNNSTKGKIKNLFEYNDHKIQNQIDSANNKNLFTNGNDYNKLLSQYALQILNKSNAANSSNINSPMIKPNIGQDLMKTSSLINELIELEQQNKIQIELIQRIIQNKYQNINYVNNILENFITQNPQEKNIGELSTKNTKSCSNTNSQNDVNRQQPMNLIEENKQQNCKLFFIFLIFLFFLFKIFFIFFNYILFFNLASNIFIKDFS